MLARHVDAEGNVTPGSKGLSLFFARMRKEDGTLNGIRLHRLKDKLGTRALPTAELELDGMQATLIGPLGRGVAQMATMLNLSRLHTCVWSLGYVARALQLATDWSFRRHASGKELYRLPLHTHHLSKLSLSYRAMTLLTFHSVHLVGKTEMAVVNNGKETEDDKWLLRLLTPVSKAFVSLESVDVIRGCIEAIGGQGYMEDGTGMARLYRDTLVNTLWEGTVNALSHDLLRVFVQTRGDAGRLLMEELGRLVDGAPRELEGAALAVKEAGALIAKIGAEMMTTVSGDGKEVDPVYERLLRELTLSVGRTVAAGIMVGWLARSR